MAAAVSSSVNPTPLNCKTMPSRSSSPNPVSPRPPLLPSDSENNKYSNVIPRRPKSRDVPSRFVAESTSSTSKSSSTNRYHSPVNTRQGNTSPARANSSTSVVVKRPQSAERSRPGPPSRINDPVAKIGASGISNAQKMLIASSRGFSVSYQGASLTLRDSNTKKKASTASSSSPSPVSIRKGVTPDHGRKTPVRGIVGNDHVENPKSAVEDIQQRWPGWQRQKLTPNGTLSRSVDLTSDRRAIGSSGITPNPIRPLRNQSSLPAYESSLHFESLKKPKKISAVSETSRWDPPISSDAESTSSASSGSTIGGCNGRRVPRNIIIPARFLNETSDKQRLPPDQPRSPASRTPISKHATPKKTATDNSIPSSRAMTNLRGVIHNRQRHASPVKSVVSSSPRAFSSPVRDPSRVRTAVVGVGPANSNNSPNFVSSLLTYNNERNVGEKIVDIHLLRMLYNRLLQWRFINARANASLLAQRSNAERSLFIAYKAISSLVDSVKAKRVELQQLNQNLKLVSIIRGQMACLRDFALIEKEYSLFLSGAAETLRASTLRLPVIGAARADLQNVRDAIISAVDVMQAMASSVCMLLSKVEEVNGEVIDLVKVASQERALLDQCMSSMSAVASLQVIPNLHSIH